MYIHYFVIIFLGKGRGPSFDQTWIPFIQGCFVRSLVEIGTVVLMKKIYKFCQCILFFVIISPWKRAGPFIWTNLNSLHSRMFCAKFGGNWPSGSGQEDENVKSLQTDRQRTTGDQKSSLEPSSYPIFSLKKSKFKNGSKTRHILFQDL